MIAGGSGGGRELDSRDMTWHDMTWLGDNAAVLERRGRLRLLCVWLRFLVQHAVIQVSVSDVSLAAPGIARACAWTREGKQRKCTAKIRERCSGFFISWLTPSDWIFPRQSVSHMFCFVFTVLFWSVQVIQSDSKIYPLRRKAVQTFPLSFYNELIN